MEMPTGIDRNTRLNRKQRRKNRAKSGGADTTNTNDYRPGAVNNGTASNNSNTTNYNSQNAVAPTTGVNAVPGTQATGAGTGNGSVSTGSTMGTSARAGSVAVANAPTPGAVANPDRAVTAANRTGALTVSDFIAGSPNHTTLQNALQITAMDKTLNKGGPFTVFAPTNESFKKLPAQTQQVLLEGKNVAVLKQLLSYHVVAGEIDAAELSRRIKAGNGKVVLQTVAGEVLTAQLGNSGTVELTDAAGGTSTVDTDYHQSNGVVHSINNVLLPKGGASLFR